MRRGSQKVYSQLSLYAPYLNKGTAFSKSERDALHLRGLLPPKEESIASQVKRCMLQFSEFNTNLTKYTYLTSLKERNETLFYHLVVQNIETMMPIIYTPTVGEACEKFGLEFRTPQGMYFTAEDKGHMAEMVNNWPHDDVSIIVVSDGSRILGLGDLGSNGMGIPVGKLSLYVAGGGFAPTSTLPVIIDVGTNNKDLIKDEFYLGLKQERLVDKAYDQIIDEFITAVKKRWPKVLIQFEDFSNNHCFRLLENYKDKTLCFNDDIQGTGAVVLAGLLNSMKILNQELSNQKFLLVGAGSAAVGCADVIRTYLKEEGVMDEEKSKDLFYFVDSSGLVTTHRGDKLSPEKIAYAREDVKKEMKSLKTVVKNIQPTCIIGLCGKAGTFSEDIIAEMTSYCERPIIFALSNPTANSECTAEDAFKWTKGKCIFASGSPMEPVKYGNKKFVVSQANNFYIFPGLGLGASLCQAKKITPAMIAEAAKALADFKHDNLSKGELYPNISFIRNISAAIALAVMKKAQKEGVSTVKVDDFTLKSIMDKQYDPSSYDNNIDPKA